MNDLAYIEMKWHDSGDIEERKVIINWDGETTPEDDDEICYYFEPGDQIIDVHEDFEVYDFSNTPRYGLWEADDD